MSRRRTFHRELSVQDLAELHEGKASQMINEAIDACVRDVERRPLNKKKRTAAISIDITPRYDSDTGFLSSCDVTIKADPKIPPALSRDYEMLVDRGKAIFSPASAENPLQPGLTDAGHEPADEPADESHP
ncbi:MAG: hypothetical protein AAGI54_00625 [Planctomycetota bacterium]